MSEFRRRGKGWQSGCKACLNASSRADYETNTARRAAVAKINRARKAENLAFLGDYFRTHPCVDCGETDLAVLEFDHVRGKKTSHVSSLVKSSLRRLKAEIALCDVRCGNCHRRRTVRVGNTWLYQAVQRHRGLS